MSVLMSNWNADGVDRLRISIVPDAHPGRFYRMVVKGIEDGVEKIKVQNTKTIRSLFSTLRPHITETEREVQKALGTIERQRVSSLCSCTYGRLFRYQLCGWIVRTPRLPIKDNMNVTYELTSLGQKVFEILKAAPVNKMVAVPIEIDNNVLTYIKKWER